MTDVWIFISLDAEIKQLFTVNCSENGNYFTTGPATLGILPSTNKIYFSYKHSVNI